MNNMYLQNMDNNPWVQYNRQRMNGSNIRRNPLTLEEVQQKSFQRDYLSKQLDIHNKNISRMQLGNPLHRNASMLKIVDGNILKITTDYSSRIESASIVTSVNELSVTEKASLYNESKNLYKRLEMNQYSPTVTDKVLGLMNLEDGVPYEKFNILASSPSKPNIDGLSEEAQQEALNMYNASKASYDMQLNLYNADREAYENGEMQQAKFACEDRVKSLEMELKGSI